MGYNGDGCQYIKPDGNHCQARRQRDSRYCFFHDPARAEERALARRTGGLKRAAAVLPVETLEQAVRTPGEVIELLGQTIHQVRTGQLDPRMGNCIGYLTSVVLRAVEQGDLEERLAALEGVVRAQGRPRDFFDDDPSKLVIPELPRDEAERESA